MPCIKMEQPTNVLFLSYQIKFICSLNTTVNQIQSKTIDELENLHADRTTVCFCLFVCVEA